MMGTAKPKTLLGRSSALLALARPVAPVLVLLAALHWLELLVLPLLVFFGRQAFGLAWPLSLALLARLLRSILHQRARRHLRQAFMVRAARDSLKLGGPAEAGADAAFWGAHILEYALCLDLPAIFGASGASVVIVVLAAQRLGTAPVGATVAVLMTAMLVGLVTSRLRRPQVDAIVERRHAMAIWMAAAMNDQGEIGSERATRAFLDGVAARARSWSQAEDRLERRQTQHRALTALAAFSALLLVARAFGLTHGLSASTTFDNIASFLLIGALLPAAYSLNAHLESLAVARAELARLLPELPTAAPRGRGPMLERPNRLDFASVVATYGGETALALDSLQLDLTRPVVVTGPNGAGKTTLAKLVAGLAVPARGAVTLDGVAASDLAPDGIAFVPQDPVVIEELSVLENLRLVAPDCSREEAEDMLGVLGVPRTSVALDQPAGSFSRGEARRIATARALLTPARLLVLDEPDAWLDANGRARLVEALLQRAARSAIVLVSHRLDVIARFDQIVALSASHGVEAVGDRAEVEARSPAFRELSESALTAPDR